MDFLKWERRKANNGLPYCECIMCLCTGSLPCMDPPVREEDEGDLSEGGDLQSNTLSSYRHHYAC